VKKQILTLLMLVTVIAFSQTPSKVNCQAVIRDALGASLTTKNVSIRFQIFEQLVGGTQVYEALTTLNISATQELLKMVNELMIENVQLNKVLSSATGDIEMIKSYLNMDKRAVK
jgi:hypothetical protein